MKRAMAIRGRRNIPQGTCLGYAVEFLSRDPKKAAYHLYGKRGARYTLWRNRNNPEVMFVTNTNGNVTALKGNYWFTDRSGKLVAISGYFYNQGNPRRSKSNPPRGAVRIYDDILSIEAQKGDDSLWPGELFRHDFKAKKGTAAIYGLPDGSLLIKGNKRLWKKFNYPKGGE